MDVRYLCVLACAAAETVAGLDSVCGGAEGRSFGSCTAGGGLKDVGGASDPDEGIRRGGPVSVVLAGVLSAYELFRVLEGVAGTDKVGRPLPMLKGGLLCGSDGGGIEAAADRSRAMRGVSDA
jgi:hypothetical protein